MVLKGYCVPCQLFWFWACCHKPICKNHLQQPIWYSMALLMVSLPKSTLSVTIDQILNQDQPLYYCGYNQRLCILQ